jgi:superfamily I DNA/RNA helicase
VAEGQRIFAEVITGDDERLGFQRKLLESLWTRRDPTMGLHVWLREIHGSLLESLIGASRTLDDEGATLAAFIARTSEDGDAAEMTLGQFAGDGEGNDRINLSTLHSAKGREFRAVVMFGMDDGRIPRNGAIAGELREARRLFYVGFTRPQEELYILYSGSRPSPFVLEVQQRIEWATRLCRRIAHCQLRSLKRASDGLLRWILAAARDAHANLQDIPALTRPGRAR